MTTKTKTKAIVSGIVLALTAGLGLHLTAQVKTEVPPPVPGAKPDAMERVKVRGTALEGNLEGNAADRDVLVYLPPSYAREKSRRYPVGYALHGYSIGAEQWASEILRFQQNVLPFFGRTLSFEQATRR